MTISTFKALTYLEKLELRLLLEGCYSSEESAAWEQPFELYAFAEAEHGSVACDELMVSHGF